MADSKSENCQCEWVPDEHCDEPYYKEHNGRRYCVLHYPDAEKQEDFLRALENRLDESNVKYLSFVGVWFPDPVHLSGKSFTSLADFSHARFNSDVEFIESHFDEVRFVGSHFKGQADFTESQYDGIADFSGAQFEQPVSFSRATFSHEGRFFRTQFADFANYSGAEFEDEAYFNLAVFNIADFSAARIPVGTDKSNSSGKPQFEIYRSKFKNAQFNGATFNRCTFKQACFSGTAGFIYAQFRDFVDFFIVDFNKVDFTNSFLTHANFDGAFFLDVPTFIKCNLQGNTVFATARLPGIDCSDAIFHGPVDFSVTRFENSLADWEKDKLQECNITLNEAVPKPIIICFDKATFKEGLTFKGIELQQEKALLSFDDSIFEKPEKVRFVAISLPPHSFMGVDPRKFNFNDARLGHINKRKALKEAKQALQKHDRTYSSPMLELAYRQLAVNAEENNRYEQAADLRYLAMEVARPMRWRRIDVFKLSWWYWLLSGYGERVRRALTALLVIWLVSAAIYWSGNATWWQPKTTPNATQSLPPTPRALTAPDALLYSAGVIALQKPEPLPANKLAKLLVLLETVLGPIQAALLALAIRRKFMR